MKRRKRNTSNLIERVLHPANLTIACKGVVSNKGAGGVYDMRVFELKDYLDQNRKQLVEQLQICQYQNKTGRVGWLAP